MHLGSFFSEDLSLQEDVKRRVDEGLQNFDAMKKVYSIRSVCLRVKRELNLRVVVPTVMCGEVSWGTRKEESHKLDMLMNCPNKQVMSDQDE